MRLAETNKKTDVDRDVKQGLSSEAPPILKSQGEEKGPVKITEKKLFFFFLIKRKPVIFLKPHGGGKA